MALTARTLRLKIDRSAALGANLTDAATGRRPRHWKGNALIVQGGIFEGSTVVAPDNAAAITIKLTESQISSTSLAIKTVATFGTIADLAAWQAGTAEHVEWSFSNAEMNIATTTAVRTLWCVVYAILDDGSELTLGASQFDLVDDASATSGDPAENPDEYYSRGEVDGLIADLLGLGVTFTGKLRIKADGTLQIYNPTTEKYHTMGVAGAAGSVAFTLDQTGEV